MLYPASPTPEPEPSAPMLAPTPDEYDAPTALAPYARVCLRCQQPIGQRSYVTTYSTIQRVDGTRVQAVGQAIHFRCPPRDTAPCPSETKSAPRRRISPHTKYDWVASGIYLAPASKRYLVYYGRGHAHKYVGSFPTLSEAQRERARYAAQIKRVQRGAAGAKATRRQRKAKR